MLPEVEAHRRYMQVHHLQELLSYEGGAEASLDSLASDSMIRHGWNIFCSASTHPSTISSHKANRLPFRLVYIMHGKA